MAKVKMPTKRLPGKERVNTMSEEIELPPWYSWGPILARGGTGVSVGDSCVGVKFGFGTPFFWPDVANDPARNFKIWQEN